MKKHVLILGGSGLVGRAIAGHLMIAEDTHICCTYHSSSRYNVGTSYPLDVGDIEGIRQLLETTKPTYVVSCLRGDFEQQLTCHKEVSSYLKTHGGRLYYCSTLNVFDKDISCGHDEMDQPEASSEYGQFKIACEELITGILGHRAIILRLPQVWGKSCIRLDQLKETYKNGEGVMVFPKLYYNVASDNMIAKQVCHIMENEMEGIFHLASTDTIQYSEFYRRLSEVLGYKKMQFDYNEEEQGQFVLITNRVKQFPKDLQETCQDVINYISGANFL